MPSRSLIKIGIAFVLGLVVVLVVPRSSTAGSAPPVMVLLLAGLIVGVVMLTALHLVLTRDIRLPTTAVMAALGFNALVILVKFVFAPNSVYDANAEAPFESFLPVSNVFGAVFASIGVFALYGSIYWVIYRSFRSRVSSSAGALRRFIDRRKRGLLAVLAGTMLLAMAGGAFILLIPLFFVASGAEYLGYVFSSAASGLIALSLLATATFAVYAFKETTDRATVAGDVGLIVSLFWVGLAFLALYHVLWVVYILVLTSIWPLKVVVPK